MKMQRKSLPRQGFRAQNTKFYFHYSTSNSALDIIQSKISIRFIRFSSDFLYQELYVMSKLSSLLREISHIYSRQGLSASVLKKINRQTLVQNRSPPQSSLTAK